MARRLNYGSHSTLSEYENGARMPSEIVVEGYERLLRLESGTLAEILEKANIDRHGDAWARRRVHLPPRFPGADEPAYGPVYGPAVGPAYRSADNGLNGGSPGSAGYGAASATTTASTPAVSASAASAASAAAAATMAVARMADSPWPEEPVVDGSDPDAAGCSPDAVTVHSRRIALNERRTVVGHVELRYSSRARAAWCRFEGYGFLDHLAGRRDDVRVVVEILRHSDGTRVTTIEPYCFDYVWGDLVVVDSGPFQARASVVVGDETVAAGETDSRQLA
jgi:hypothetical protein